MLPKSFGRLLTRSNGHGCYYVFNSDISRDDIGNGHIELVFLHNKKPVETLASSRPMTIRFGDWFRLSGQS